MRQNPHKSKRVQLREGQPVRRDTTIQEWPETGLVMADGPGDPIPSVRVESGRVVELDGRTEGQFDSIDLFIARHAIDTQVADQAMAMPPLDLARMLFDPRIEAKRIRRLFGGLSPARLVQVVWYLDVLEMMLALRKMRLRKRPANQAHVTNRRDHPALLAADAAEAARRGFAEVETTVGVAPLAPLNSIAVLIGSQVGRPGVLTQAAVEEGVNLRLALKGLVSYAETLSVYGTASSFHDGDDTPWSKAFLASAYASRGVKVRFTSGSGSELLMGHAGGHSMLYLEARCLMVVKGAGSQGVQNGAISCIALPLSLPAGIRGVMAENLMAASLGLEVASGNDALASHSDTRKSAKLMLQFLPGTDFVTSGYSVMPREDNLFGGGNFEAKDLDAWTLLQRDFQIDAGITPVPEDEIIRVRDRAARAVQAVYQGLGLSPISDEEVISAVTALNSDDLPSRSQAEDVAGATRFFDSTATVLDVARILQRENFHPEAQALMALTRQRAAGDYLQPAAILTPTEGDLQAESAFNTPHFYSGPGTGYRVEGARWDQLKEVPFARRPQDLVQPTSNNPVLRAVRTTKPKSGAEVVVGLSPAFGHPVSETLSGLSHQDVLKEIQKGIEQEGGATRLIHVLDTADCAFIGHQAAQLSGSGIAIGLQSRGTAVIHRHDLAPLDNLELLSQAPNLTLESYRALGRNAARYARGFKTEPIPVKIDNTSRLRHIVQTTLLHRIEVEATVPGAEPVEVELVDEEVGSDGRESKLRHEP